jgi:hypothetical protein
MEPQLAILHTSPFLVVGAWGPIYITSWRETMTADDLERSVALADDIYKTFRRYAAVAIVGPDLGLPTAEARNGIRKAIRETVDRDLISVLVFDGPAFWASAMRTMFASLLVFAGSRRRDRIVTKLEEAALIAHNYANAPKTPSELFKALVELRSTHVAASAPPPG